MGFFKDFKDDFSDAVDEMIPEEGNKPNPDDVMVHTLDEDRDAHTALSQLDSLL